MKYDKVEFSSDIAQEVEREIINYSKKYPDTRKQLAGYAKKFSLLPLVNHWTETIGIASDGSIRKFATDETWEWYEGLRFVDSRGEFYSALVEGAREFPFLSVLIPDRPGNAIDCPSCWETKEVLVKRGMICGERGNLHWVEAADNSP